MPPTINIFDSDAFSDVTMTAAVNKMDYAPGGIRQLGIFRERPIMTTSAWIEEDEDQISIVPTSPRGAPPSTETIGRRKARAFETVHIERQSTVYADAVQNVRQFGTDTLQFWQNEIRRHQERMARKIEATIENLCLGALRGQIQDADGTVLLDLFTEFGVDQYDAWNFNLADKSTDIRAVCQSIRRAMARELGALSQTRFDIHALCADDFFDALISHQTVKDAYERWQVGAALREDWTHQTFMYAGIMFDNYRGTDDGTSIAIEAGKAHLFPVIRNELYELVFAPSDYLDDANTLGLPLYSRMIPNPNGKSVSIEVQSNPLPVCTRPRCLMTGNANLGGTVKK